uniref:Uncharacterized protein n=1 Tax=Globodera rostochiensis TaxID=31243 RepID=A0A914GXZ0_GLORO
MSQKVLDEQNPSEPKNGRVVVVVAEEGSKVDDGHDKPTVGGDGQAEEHGEKGDRTFVLSSPMEVNSAADSAGGLAEEMGGEAPNGEEKVVGDQRQENAEGEEQPSEGADEVGGGRERTETAQIGTGADGAQPPPEKTPPKLRIHRVFRNEEGFEVRQSETVADTRLVEQYLKMRMLCSREQLWRFAFDDANAEKDFRAMRRRLQKRFKYYENKQKLEVTTKKAAGKRAGEGETAEAKQKALIAANNLRPSTSAAVQSPFRPSPPSSSGYSTTTTTSSAPEGKTPPAVGGRHGGRGTARRPNAGTKRQRYSPGAEALNPQQESQFHRHKLVQLRPLIPVPLQSKPISHQPHNKCRF